MKKYLLLLIIVAFASGWSPADVVPAFKNLKTDITAQLSELFDREVSIENVSGILVNQIELNNVSIAREKKLSEGTIIKAKQIILNYNPFKLATSRGNIAAAISKIVIIEPDIVVERSIRDEWNMAGLIPKSAPIEGERGPSPLNISAKIQIKGGYGVYIDHMGFGEPLNGTPFISKIRDFNSEIKVSGNRINVSGTATSVIDRSIAYTKTTGNLNTRTGKYYFEVTAKNVDIKKWGYYTMNIPHFKPISGLSDMKLTMTNPPPREKGLPIFFDGKFWIKDGTATIFGKHTEKINGFVNVHDEKATFKNLNGSLSGLSATANGLIYDFTVANYDISLDIPKTESSKIKTAFPEIKELGYSGNVRSTIHIGGNYGFPVFKGTASLDGDFLKQKVTGDLNFSFEGSVLQLNLNNLSAYGGKVFSKGVFDFTTGVPHLDLNINAKSLDMKKISGMSFLDKKIDLDANIKGSLEKFTIDGITAFPKEAIFNTFGTYESGNFDLALRTETLNNILVKGKISEEALSVVSIEARNLAFFGENLEKVSLNLSWLNDRLAIKDSIVKSRYTNIRISGTLEPTGSVNLIVSGNLDLAAMKPLTVKYGRLFGRSKISCLISGKTDDPNLDIDFDIDQLRFNEIIFDKVSGRIIKDGSNIYLAKPLSITKVKDEYLISGKFSIAGKRPLDIKADLLKCDLKTLSSLLADINKELSTKQIFIQSVSQKSVSLNTSQLRFPQIPMTMLYKSDGDKTNIEQIKLAEVEAGNFSKTLKEKAETKLGGKVFGYLSINGPMNNASGTLDLLVTNGSFESYTFDEARLKANYKEGTFEVSSAYIKKGDGKLSISGNYNPSTTVSAEISAVNMPLDFMNLFLGQGKTFDGKFTMEGRLAGPVSRPAGYLKLKTDNIKITGINYDSFDASLNLKDNVLFINNLRFKRNNNNASLYGQLPLYKEGINLSVSLEGESVGLLTLASKDVHWIQGSGLGSIKISGSLPHPKFNGSLSLNNAMIYLKIIDSNLESINADLQIIDNSISSDKISAKWVGKWTGGHINKIRISGKFDWDGWYSDEKFMDFDLKFNDTSYTVDLPNLYKGDMEVKDLSFTGPLEFREENPRVPKLSGTISLRNGSIILPDLSKKSNLPNIKMGLTLNILKNTYVTAGDIKNLISTDFSNLLMNLELEGDEISISGDLKNPNITGKTSFKRGTVNLLNREFSLMTVDRQKNIYATDIEKVKENEAVFSGGSLPSLSLSSEIKVKSVEEIYETVKPGELPKLPTYKTTNVLVVSRISGVPYSKEKETGIKLAFDAFVEDSTKQPPELIPGKYDEEEIKVLLLPDFIKGPLGVNQRGVQDIDANAVVADYLNSRLNSYLFRGVERDLAKSLELESLTLEYNFGKDLKNMMPAKSPTEIGPQEIPETMYGIGAVKGFFERFYIDLKYSQAVQEQAIINKAYLNYQITYKLSPVLSVVYYREPFSFLEEESDYYKVTLKAGYQL